MPDNQWQKSSFCGGGGNNFLEVQIDSDTIRIRESERPDRTIETTPGKLTDFIKGAKAGKFDHLT